MRSLLGIALGGGILTTIVAFIACGPPSSFDNITGAPPLTDSGSNLPLVEDATLVGPRALAPLSGSFFNGTRPTLRWELVAPAIGARVTMCRDAKCEDAAKKSFSASGRELTVPEDLEPGIWFWRLTSTTATSFGTLPSQTFSLVVRGGKAGGTPVGSILDTNGDGKIDLLLSVEEMGTGSTRFGVLLLGTSIDDPTAVSADVPDLPLFDNVSPNAVFQSTDLDGDGFSDPIMAAEIVRSGSPPIPFVEVGTGAATEVGFDLNYRILSPELPPLDGIPFIRAPGDVDLDGYGDLLVGTKTTVFASYGGPDGLAVLSILDQISLNGPPDAGILPPPTAPIANGGHGVADDGRTGVVHASYVQGPPFVVQRIVEARLFDDEPTSLIDTPPPTPATNFASGDLDGDGKTDLVFLTSVSGKASICVRAGSEVPLNAKIACWAPATAPDGFALNMAVADLEGDGKDEVLVSATTGGIDVLSLPEPGKVVAEHLTIDHGARITVMHPGRPKPAVWAATRSDGASVGIYRGKERVRVIDPLPLFGASPTKFGLPIR